MTPFRKPELPAVNPAVHAGPSGAKGPATPNPKSITGEGGPVPRSPKGAGGFSLIFMSIFITLMAMLMVAVLPDVRNDNARTIDDIDKLNTVEEHMRSFMAFNGRRPCPADGQYSDLGTGSKYFGKEAGTPGVCQGNTAPTPNAPLGPDGSGNIVAGVIPTRSIGLSDDYAFDSYGRRFTYVVDKRATSHAFCQNLEGLTLTNTTPTGKGGITIKDAAENSIDQVMYAYIQYGPSGYGAWPGDGSATALSAAQSAARRVNSGSTDKYMQTDAWVDVAGSPPGASGFTPTPSATLYKNSLITPYTTGGKLDTGFSDLVWYRDDLKNTCCLGPTCIPKGFIVPGLDVYDAMGASISAAGDFDQDGKTDMAITAAGSGSSAPSNVYVMFGKSGLFSDPTLTTSFTGSGSSGFKVFGWNPGCGNHGWTYTTAAIGDVNGDGYPDLVIAQGGVYCGTSNTIYVIYGGPGPRITAGPWNVAGSWSSGWPAAGIDVKNYNGTGIDGIMGAVIHLSYPTSTITNLTISLADINGDGKKDIIIGDNNDGENNPATGVYQAGSVFVILGRNDGLGWQTGTYASPYQISDAPGNYTLDGSNGFVINGDASGGAGSHFLGSSLATGDLNGDTLDDIVINRANPWEHFVIFGQKLGIPYSSGPGDSAHNWPSPFDLTTLNGSNGFAVTAPSCGTWAGNQAFVDLNHDGVKDLALGTDCSGWTAHSKVRIIWGQQAGSGWNGGAWPATISLDSPPAGCCTKITTTLTASNSGLLVGAIGDVNGDGTSDLGIAYPAATVSGKANAGIAWVVYGKSGGWSDLDLSTLTGSNGFEITGCVAGGNLGLNGMTGGDINADGYSDIMIGAPTATYSGNGNAGIGYVVYGKKSRSYGSLSLCGL